MQVVRSICAPCQQEQGIPEQDNDSHGLCDDHLRKLYPDQAEQVLAIQAQRQGQKCFHCPVTREKRCDGSCGLGCVNCPGTVAA